MELNNSFTVSLPVAEAWPVLTDVQRVVSCMPGVTLDSVEGDEINATMKVKLGPIQLSYRGAARFLELDENAHRLVIEAAGKDIKGAGTASATVQMTLNESDAGSDVKVVTNLMVTGKPAQFGRGALQDVSSTMINKFSDALERELARDEAGLSPHGPSPDVPTVAPMRPNASAHEGTRPQGNEDAIDLRDFAGPIVKRLAPMVAGAIVLGLLVAKIARRKF